MGRKWLLTVTLVLVVVGGAVWGIAAARQNAAGQELAVACQPGAGQPAVKGARPPAAAFRVDQAGYPARGPKQAELMTSSGTGWELISAASCKVVATGRARTRLGSWNRDYPAVWAVTFGSVRRAGTYRLRYTPNRGVVSPWFRIGAAASIYGPALASAVSFYTQERDGAGFARSALRSAPGHLNDGSAMTYTTPPADASGSFKGSLAGFATGVRIDASGGWWDAGDYLKFTETTSYTVAALLSESATFPSLAAKTGVTAEARFGLDFLGRMWDQRTKTLYYQVGIGTGNSSYVSDHDIWRLPQADDGYGGGDPKYSYIRHPPVLRAGPPGSPISPNLAGRLAADFALCYRVLRTADPGYAANCLLEAETVYQLAGTSWRGPLVTAFPAAFYPESSWRDDMMLGASELALALEPAPGKTLPPGLPVTSYRTYLAAAADWASQWSASQASREDTLNLYDVTALADYELSRAIAAAPAGAASSLAVTRAGLLAGLRSQIQLAIRIAGRTRSASGTPGTHGIPPHMVSAWS